MLLLSSIKKFDFSGVVVWGICCCVGPVSVDCTLTAVDVNNFILYQLY